MAGALTNDSGPLLAVVAVFVLAVVTAYLVGGVGLGAGAPATSDAGSGVAERPTMQESAPATDGPEGGRPSATVP